jgi:hypothetical protein
MRGSRMRGSRRARGGAGGLWLAGLVVACAVALAFALAEIVTTLLVRLPLALLLAKPTPPKKTPAKPFDPESGAKSDGGRWLASEDQLNQIERWYDDHVVGGGRLRPKVKRTA